MTTGAGQKTPPALPSASGASRWLGRYELLHEIASGGMATVYLGRARGAAGFERVVAIKVCHPHLRGDEEFATMFLDEARLAARIHHPNVVGTLDVGDDETLYLVMEYVEGDRLSGLIKAAAKKGTGVPVEIGARLMIDALSGLHAAHELTDPQGRPLQIVHRDVSPQNILVGIDGVARITDFGIAKAEARVTVTREGQVKGKMSYMAPEQMTTSKVDRRADVYAAGVVLWETLTGRRLFRTDSDAETLNLVLHGVVPKPSSVTPGLTPELDEIVGKALERDPERRYATAADFAEALENASFKIATARAVAATVQDYLGESIAARRELVRKLDEAGVLTPERSLVRSTAGASGSYPGAAHFPYGDRPSAVPAEPPPQPPQHSRTPLYAGLGLVAVLALGVGAFALRPRPTPVETPSAALVRVPPSVLPMAPVPPMQPEAQVAPTPLPAIVPTSPESPTVAANTGIRRPPRGRPPRVAPNATNAAVTTPRTNTTRLPTGVTPPRGNGEFRPGSI